MACSAIGARLCTSDELAKGFKWHMALPGVAAACPANSSLSGFALRHPESEVLQYETACNARDDYVWSVNSTAVGSSCKPA